MPSGEAHGQLLECYYDVLQRLEGAPKIFFYRPPILLTLPSYTLAPNGMPNQPVGLVSKAFFGYTTKRPVIQQPAILVTL